MPQKFGMRVRTLREEQAITREDFCGDESELSVRQLARIESGKIIPGLEKVSYIANRLGMKIGELTDGESFAIPRRYKEIKYAILRKPL
ncbi:XRE family transcriptional regulator [Streptococcus sp. X16XC17]|uniref:helix-turn-helix domain-containing protein n=1 Tax=unclassified Streptococcus TaxID=2608887 RepID=UPI00066FC1FB|nr:MULTISPECIES: helix-turn-helix transcriptional regulator [unclassified Streptococcus]TCD45877.1 XRE family transcriptional regulator [Streptococcus sp. X16XC17]